MNQGGATRIPSDPWRIPHGLTSADFPLKPLGGTVYKPMNLDKLARAGLGETSLGAPRKLQAQNVFSNFDVD